MILKSEAKIRKLKLTCSNLPTFPTLKPSNLNFNNYEEENKNRSLALGWWPNTSNATSGMADFFPNTNINLSFRPVASAAGEQSFLWKQWDYASLKRIGRKMIARDILMQSIFVRQMTCMLRTLLAAQKQAKMILCEKPLARQWPKRKTMLDAVEKAGVKNTVWYNYRRVPAVTLAKNNCGLFQGKPG